MSNLIDSSAWIDFIRGGETAQPAVAAALRDGSAALTEPVWFELWSGARGKREETFLNGLRATCQWLTLDEPCWESTYGLCRKARKSGLACPLADVLIVACAKRHGAGLIHRDKHIDHLLKL